MPETFPIIETAYRYLKITDSEPLTNDPDPSAPDKIEFTLDFIQDGTTFLLDIRGHSNSTDRISAITFNETDNHLIIELSSNANQNGGGYNDYGYRFTPLADYKDVQVSVLKNDQKVGRKLKHKVIYSNTD
ncbi:MAG: hypothetical protein QM534_19015 [Sediminibacterium sp.]|nr:hypothetical protein [Sediminibacterium sp.]